MDNKIICGDAPSIDSVMHTNDSLGEPSPVTEIDLRGRARKPTRFAYKQKKVPESDSQEVVVSGNMSVPSNTSFNGQYKERSASEELDSSPRSTIYLKELKKKNSNELIAVAESMNILSYHNLNKQELIFYILKTAAEIGDVVIGEGVLEVLHDSG